MQRIHTFLAILLLGLMGLGAQAQQRTDELSTGQGISGQDRPMRQDRAGRGGANATLREANQAARDGDMARARSLVDGVLQREPDNARAHFVKAQIAARDNDVATARSELQAAEKLSPGLTFAREQAVNNLRKRVERLEAREGRGDRPRAGRNARDRDVTPPAGMPPAESRAPANDTGSTTTADATPSAGTTPSAAPPVETRPAGEDTRNMGAPERKVEGFGISNQLVIGLLIGAVVAIAAMVLLRRRRPPEA